MALERLLDMQTLQVHVPCPKKWDDLDGNERRRFCEQCGKHVHNLSLASSQETAQLTRQVESGARVCVAYFADSTGNIQRQRGGGWAYRLRLVLSVLAPSLGWGGAVAGTPDRPQERREARLDADGEIVLGKVAAPTPTPTPSPIRGEAAVTPVPVLGDAIAVPPPKE